VRRVSAVSAKTDSSGSLLLGGRVTWALFVVVFDVDGAACDGGGCCDDVDGAVAADSCCGCCCCCCCCCAGCGVAGCMVGAGDAGDVVSAANASVAVAVDGEGCSTMGLGLCEGTWAWR
jgi:hypothetical protein